MYIREHINFERGIDPKDAMQTGDIRLRMYNKIVSDLELAKKELAKLGCVDFEDVPDIPTSMNVGTVYVFQLTFKNPKVHDNLFLGATFIYKKNNSSVRYWVEPDFVYGVNSKYYDDIDSCIYLYKIFFMKNFESQIVREHINFERGIDPKRAMGTGDKREQIKQQIKKAITELAETYGGYEVVEGHGDNMVLYQFYKEHEAAEWCFYIKNEKDEDDDEWSDLWACGWYQNNPPDYSPKANNPEFYYSDITYCVKKIHEFFNAKNYL